MKIGSDVFIAHLISVETCFLIGCSIVWNSCVGKYCSKAGSCLVVKSMFNAVFWVYHKIRRSEDPKISLYLKWYYCTFHPQTSVGFFTHRVHFVKKYHSLIHVTEKELKTALSSGSHPTFKNHILTFMTLPYTKEMSLFWSTEMQRWWIPTRESPHKWMRSTIQV